MPEGDTIHKLAAWLAPRLEGRRLAGLRLRDDPTVERRGALVEAVRAQGKHLFVRLEDGWTLRTHLGMHGSWHAYERGERWKLPERSAHAVLATDDAVYVCFDAAECELMRTAGRRARRVERHLGPDLTAEDEPDLDAVVARARALLPAEAPLADVLLDQRVACGIGNVYKSECLFLHGLAPLRALGTVEDEALRATFASARRLLRANLRTGPRRTRPAADPERLWVYGRAPAPCPRCGTRLETARLGRHARSTTWCPACQPT